MKRGNISRINLGKEPEDLHFHSIVDHKILRAISKITFNYFSYQYGKEAAFSERFDSLRKYIRYDLPVSHLVVQPVNEKIYHRKQLNGQYGVGHIIVIQQNQQGDLVAHVSLFNSHVYEIKLCEKFICSLPAKGSLFDTKEKVIHTEIGQMGNYFLMV